MTISVDQRGGGFRARVRRKGFSASKTFPTQAEATRWAEQVIGEVAGNKYVDHSREQTTSLKSVLQRYLKEVTPEKKSAKTETKLLNTWMKQPWAALPITSVNQSHITEWRDGRVAAGKAPTTINNPLNLLQNVFTIAKAEWGYRVENPVKGIRRRKQRRGRVAVPDDDLEKTLILKAEASEARWLAPFIAIAGWTAMRQGEIRTMRWSFIDFDRHFIHLPETKNDDERWVPMLPRVEETLRRWAGNKETSGDIWIFPALIDTAEVISEDTVGSGFRRLMAGVWDDAEDHQKPKKITFHDLRHWGCTRLAEYHNDAMDLAITTGHRTVQTLRRYYNPDQTERAERIRAAAAARETRRALAADNPVGGTY